MSHEMEILSGAVNGSSPSLIPLPRCRAGEVSIRPATLADLPFMDALQKLHTKMVGWMPTATLEGKIKAGHVLIAEELTADITDSTDKTMHLSASSALSAVKSLGYCIATDQYFKHDDVGIIYQLNVVPGRQRGLIGASLLKAQFERSAYGCRLYCCWCAQDIAANHFWEAMGFVPLAFRAGSEKRSRVHIFWQKRIRQGDTTTPWWFPSKTAGGSIREDRIVLPIPPGTHWSDAKPLILPAEELPVVRGQLSVEEKKPRAKTPAPVVKPKAMGRNGLIFDIPKRGEALAKDKSAAAAKQPPKPPRAKRVCDPRLVSAARELRDRWLEEVNAGRYLPAAQGKYEVARQIAAQPAGRLMLNAA